MNEFALYLAATVLVAWGVAHLLATRGVIAGFGELSADNRRIIAMEWIVEGVTFVAVAAFVAATTVAGRETAVAGAVYGVAIATLVALAVVSLFTGFRIAFLPFRMCPFVAGGAAALIAGGAWL